MTRYLIYGAGLLVIAFVVGLLLFLTFENAVTGTAVYGTRSGSFRVSGFASILVNVGIVGLVLSTVSYIIYLAKRSASLLKCYQYIGAVSGVFILLGALWGAV